MKNNKCDECKWHFLNDGSTENNAFSFEIGSIQQQPPPEAI